MIPNAHRQSMLGTSLSATVTEDPRIQRYRSLLSQTPLFRGASGDALSDLARGPFDAAPPVQQWSTLTWYGAASDITSATNLDLAAAGEHVASSAIEGACYAENSRETISSHE